MIARSVQSGSQALSAVSNLLRAASARCCLSSAIQNCRIILAGILARTCATAPKQCERQDTGPVRGRRHGPSWRLRVSSGSKSQ
jgi:hypothetical protein